MRITLILSALLMIFFTGCAPRQDSLAGLFKMEEFSSANLKEYKWDEIKGWESNDFEESFTVFKESCDKTLVYKDMFKEACLHTDGVTEPKIFFETYFRAYRLYNDDGSDTGVITGYYEPLLEGSRTKSKRFCYPVYKRPADLLTIKMDELYPELAEYRMRGRLVGNTVVPYYSRAEIVEKDNLTETICYVDNDIDLFYLHIQGSGRIRLDTGEIINVGYIDQNGRKYQSIGKMVLERGIVPSGQASLQGMKKFLSDNPDKKAEILNYNPSFIFFEEKTKRATGSLGIELTPQRSIAVDTRYIPLGSPVFIATKNPATKDEIQRLVFAQDRGGAIKGTIRADYFWGFGKEAEEHAGIMKEQGGLWVLLPRSATVRTE